MKPQERADLVLRSFNGSERRWSDMFNDLPFDRNQLYSALKLLSEQDEIYKVRHGVYDLLKNKDTPRVADSAKSTSNGKNVGVVPPEVAPKKKTEKTPEVVLESAPILNVPPPLENHNDIEEIATALLGKIGELKPMLLLHEAKFNDIESTLLSLIDAVIEIRPRILSVDEFSEYLELKECQRRAKTIAATKLMQLNKGKQR